MNREEAIKQAAALLRSPVAPDRNVECYLADILDPPVNRDREMLEEVRQEISNTCARFAYTDEADVCQPLDELESMIDKHLKEDL